MIMMILDLKILQNQKILKILMNISTMQLRMLNMRLHVMTVNVFQVKKAVHLVNGMRNPNTSKCGLRRLDSVRNSERSWTAETLG